jgi:hypothetical protein
MAIGKGISEAVRNTVLEWLDSDTVTRITKEAKKKDPDFYYGDLICDNKAWVRKSRRKSPTGHSRSYRCNLISGTDLELEVRSNPPDTRITYYAFKVNGKFITGGQSDVASVNVYSDKPNVAKVGATAHASAVGTLESGVKTKIGGFRRLSEDEINKLNAQIESESTFDRLFEERE